MVSPFVISLARDMANRTGGTIEARPLPKWLVRIDALLFGAREYFGGVGGESGDVRLYYRAPVQWRWARQGSSNGWRVEVKWPKRIWTLTNGQRDWWGCVFLTRRGRVSYLLTVFKAGGAWLPRVRFGDKPGRQEQRI